MVETSRRDGIPELHAQRPGKERREGVPTVDFHMTHATPGNATLLSYKAMFDASGGRTN